MPIATSVLKPGYMVSLKTAVKGGVLYERRDLEANYTNENGESVARWETTRRIDDPAEHARAVKVRSQAMTIIRRICIASGFGLLCRAEREAELDAAIKEARAVVDAFNVEAQTCHVAVNVMKGYIAPTDEEAARGIANEVRELLESMQSGIAQVDVKAIRDAANKARQVGTMLDGAQATKVSMAVEVARSAAREITKRIEKGGEDAKRVLAEMSGSTAAIEATRIAFLDFEPEVKIDSLPGVDARDVEV